MFGFAPDGGAKDLLLFDAEERLAYVINFAFCCNATERESVVAMMSSLADTLKTNLAPSFVLRGLMFVCMKISEPPIFLNETRYRG